MSACAFWARVFGVCVLRVRCVVCNGSRAHMAAAGWRKIHPTLMDVNASVALTCRHQKGLPQGALHRALRALPRVLVGEFRQLVAWSAVGFSQSVSWSVVLYRSPERSAVAFRRRQSHKAPPPSHL
jgi:hypothetical protein